MVGQAGPLPPDFGKLQNSAVHVEPHPIRGHGDFVERGEEGRKYNWDPALIPTGLLSGEKLL